MTNKTDISPYVRFEDMEEGVEYAAFSQRGFKGSRFARDGNELLWYDSPVAVSAKSNLVFIPRYTPPKPVNSWNEYVEHPLGNAIFRVNGYLFLPKMIQALVDDPKAHAAFNDLIEHKRNQDG